MISHYTFGVLSSFIEVICAMPYYAAIYHRTSRPHSFSWFVWALTMGIGFLAQAVSKAGPGSWAIGVGAINCLVIGLLGLRYGEKNITVGDWLSFFAALCAIPLWIFTHHPLYSVILLATIDTIGFYPTLRKSWNDPHSEPAFCYIMGAVGFVFGLCALEDFSPTNWIYAACMITTNTIFVCVLFARRRLVFIVAKID